MKTVMEIYKAKSIMEFSEDFTNLVEKKLYSRNNKRLGYDHTVLEELYSMLNDMKSLAKQYLLNMKNASVRVDLENKMKKVIDMFHNDKTDTLFIYTAQFITIKVMLPM